jgi:hypothetical protein
MCSRFEIIPSPDRDIRRFGFAHLTLPPNRFRCSIDDGSLIIELPDPFPFQVLCSYDSLELLVKHSSALSALHCLARGEMVCCFRRPIVRGLTSGVSWVPETEEDRRTLFVARNSGLVAFSQFASVITRRSDFDRYPGDQARRSCESIPSRSP